MRKLQTLLVLALVSSAVGCSRRDFLTRHLAGELISASDTFKTTQEFWLRVGTTSNKDYQSPEYMVFQHRGWITAATVACPPNVEPPPCWDVALTPLGVGVLRDLIPQNTSQFQYFSVVVARRQLVEITGIAKSNGLADVDFQWRWFPLNEVGEALYAHGVQYKSTVTFRDYDDGWRVLEEDLPKSGQTLEEALKNARPMQ